MVKLSMDVIGARASRGRRGSVPAAAQGATPTLPS